VTNKETRNWGAFAEATYPFTDTLRLTAGARYDDTYIQNNQIYTVNAAPGLLPEVNTTQSISGDEGTRKFNNATYKLRIETDLTPSNLLYGSVSTGFLPGDVSITTGQNSLGANVPQVFPYKEETLTAYELGSKNRFLDNSLQLNGSVYYYNYGGYQIIINTSGNPQAPSFTPITVPARMRGVELESLYQLTENDRIGLSYAYIRAFFVDPPPVFSQYVAQMRFTRIAPVTVSASYDHTFNLPGGSTLELHGDARYASRHDVATITPQQVVYEPYVEVPGEWVENASLKWASPEGKYSMTGYVRNLSDNRYKFGGGVSTGPSGALTSAAYTPYDPRTIGVVLNASF
jgi:iron complex outermembrane receptor protein